MNARRDNHRDDMTEPHDAMARIVRATSEAMEAFVMTDPSKDKDGEGIAINPLMANPAIMMAAATAYGIRMTGQWASLFLNAMQDQAEKLNRTDEAVEPSETKAEAATPATVEPVEAPAVTVEVVEPVEAPVKRAKKAAKAAAPRKVAAKPNVVAASGAAEDLKLISGIGPKLANVLLARGINSYAALAEMDDAALKALDAELGLDGRVLRDDWAGQARAILASRG